MSSGRRDLERAPRQRLAAHVGEVLSRAVLGIGRRGHRARPIDPRAPTRPPRRASPPDSPRAIPRARPRGAARGTQQMTRPAAPRPLPRARVCRAPRESSRRATARRSPPSDSNDPVGSARSRRAGRGPPARSIDAPSLRCPAGARFTVTRRSGGSRPALRSAGQTRSRTSRAEGSGNPTSENPGKPGPTSTSQSTGKASRPHRAAVLTRASMDSLRGGERIEGADRGSRRDAHARFARVRGSSTMPRRAQARWREGTRECSARPDRSSVRILEREP